MKIKQYMLLQDWQNHQQHETWPFPENASQAFWELALQHAAVINAGYVVMGDQMMLQHEDALDEYLEKGDQPVEWLYWLFQNSGTHEPDYEMFHLVYLWPDGVPSYNKALSTHEFVVQSSDGFPGQYEVYDLTDDCVIHLEADAGRAQGWLDEQLRFAEQMDQYDRGDADYPDFSTAQYLAEPCAKGEGADGHA